MSARFQPQGTKRPNAYEKLVSLNAALVGQLESTTRALVEFSVFMDRDSLSSTEARELARENERLIAEAKAVQP